MPPAALRGACRNHLLPWQRAGKGLELLRSPPSRRDGVFFYQRGIAGTCPARGLSLRGQRPLASPRMDPGGFPCPVLSWNPQVLEQPPSELSQGAPCLWDSTINLSSSSSSSSSSVPHNARAGAATAAFVKHFKARAARAQAAPASPCFARGRVRLCPLLARLCWGSRRAAGRTRLCYPRLFA